MTNHDEGETVWIDHDPAKWIVRCMVSMVVKINQRPQSNQMKLFKILVNTLDSVGRKATCHHKKY